MNEADIKVKIQIADKIKSSTNILITVSENPSVDELSAAIGLTAFLNKLDKHATAIFSGAIPPAISFLDPDKVFESTADSLRDFIIALDKEKADHLRYKVDGDVVKIFITPYRTTINEQDLEFSQGDFNVELVLALGVDSQEHLDKAIAANGQQMLHDVTIATFSAGDQSSQLGSMDWRDANASSLCEMVTSISDVIRTDKVSLDKQIATALLTGIVAATDRFSNNRTTSQVMTVAAQLMAAGADQQLIAAKLQEPHEITSLPSAAVPTDGTLEIPKATDFVKTESTDEQSELPPDIFSIPHNPEEDETGPAAFGITTPPEFNGPLSGPAAFGAGIHPDSFSATTEPTSVEISQFPTPPLPPSPQFIETPLPIISRARVEGDPIKDVVGPTEKVDEPLLGGILNATSDQAAEDARRELDEQQNKTILSHSYLSGSDTTAGAPINSAGEKEDNKIVDIFSDGPIQENPEPTAPTGGLPLPPPLPDFSTLPPPTDPSILNVQNPSSTMSTLPESDTNDPSQFQIPV